MEAILVVEDEPLLGWHMSEALRDEGYEAIAVTNADDAIKVLESRNDVCRVPWAEIGCRPETSLAVSEHQLG